MIKFCVDGHEFENEESALAGDGRFAPFRIFDIKNQDYLPGTYQTREEAENNLPTQNVPPPSNHSTAGEADEQHRQIA
jgi:hypothetical protein